MADKKPTVQDLIRRLNNIVRHMGMQLNIDGFRQNKFALKEIAHIFQKVDALKEIVLVSKDSISPPFMTELLRVLIKLCNQYNNLAKEIDFVGSFESPDEIVYSTFHKGVSEIWNSFHDILENLAARIEAELLILTREPKKQNTEAKDKGELAETEQNTKREREGVIEPKPPEILAKILWLRKNWRQHWKLIVVCIFALLISGLFVLPKIELFSNKPDITASTNIFADVSKDGTILRSNDFPWEIRKSVDQNGNILYTIVDRRGDATAVSVVPDYPKYTVYQSYDGMVIKYTCSENEISDFTIKLKY